MRDVPQEQKREIMRTAGVVVEPNPAGGFQARNVPANDMLWAATEELAWGYAWIYGKFKAQPR